MCPFFQNFVFVDPGDYVNNIDNVKGSITMTILYRRKIPHNVNLALKMASNEMLQISKSTMRFAMERMYTKNEALRFDVSQQ